MSKLLPLLLWRTVVTQLPQSDSIKALRCHRGPRAPPTTSCGVPGVLGSRPRPGCCNRLQTKDTGHSVHIVLTCFGP